MENNETNDKLIKSAIKGDIELAIEALTEGADLNYLSNKGDNLLYLSGIRNHKDYFEWILEVTQKGNSININHQNITGDTVLKQFCDQNINSFFIEKLLEKGADPNIVNNDNVSPLFQACANKNEDIASLLVKYKSNVNLSVGHMKAYPLLVAAQNGSLDIIKNLIEDGKADINVEDSYQRNILLTALFKSDQFLKKDEKIQRKEMIDYILGLDIDFEHQADSGVSAVFLTSLFRDKKSTNILLDKISNADIWHIMTHDTGKTSILHLWTQAGEVEIVNKILSKGGKIGVADEVGNLPESFGLLNPDLFPLMLENKANPNAELIQMDKKGDKFHTPVFSLLCQKFPNNEEDVINKMLTAGANVEFKNIEDSLQPMVISTISLGYENIKLLLKENKIDINKTYNIIEDSPEMSSLMILVSGFKNHKLAEVQQLKSKLNSLQKAQKKNQENNVESNILSNEHFETINKLQNTISEFEKDLEKTKKSIFKLLFKNGAKVDLEDKEGKTALFYAKTELDLKTLLDNNANLIHKNNDGFNALDFYIMKNSDIINNMKDEYIKNNINLDNIYYKLAFADINSFIQQNSLTKGIIKFGNLEEYSNYLVNGIVEKDKEPPVINVKHINYQDDEGNTPLIVSIQNEKPFLANLYLKMGADINLTNNLGESPLMHAVATENIQLVDYLIEKGADLNIINKSGKTVFDIAKETDNFHLLKSLEPKEDKQNNKKSVRI